MEMNVSLRYLPHQSPWAWRPPHKPETVWPSWCSPFCQLQIRQYTKSIGLHDLPKRMRQRERKRKKYINMGNNIIIFLKRNVQMVNGLKLKMADKVCCLFVSFRLFYLFFFTFFCGFFSAFCLSKAQLEIRCWPKFECAAQKKTKRNKMRFNWKSFKSTRCTHRYRYTDICRYTDWEKPLRAPLSKLWHKYVCSYS